MLSAARALKWLSFLGVTALTASTFLPTAGMFEAYSVITSAIRCLFLARKTCKKQKTHLPGLSGGGLHYDSTRARFLDCEPPSARAHGCATQTAWTTIGCRSAHLGGQ